MSAWDPLVMIVEDDDAIRKTIADVLQERGRFRTLTATNGVDALKHLETVRPDVMIVDLLMPDMHGWAFMESYLELTGGEPIPIVVVSVNPALPRSFNRFGVLQVVSKPFDVDELLEAVELASLNSRSKVGCE